jgi:hypothetical protein
MTTTPSIIELVEQLDETLIAYNQADERAIAAYHSKDDLQDDAQHAEMERLAKVERALQKAVCASRASTRDEVDYPSHCRLAFGSTRRGGKPAEALKARIHGNAIRDFSLDRLVGNAGSVLI